MQGAIRNRGIPTGRIELPMYQAGPLQVTPGREPNRHTHTIWSLASLAQGPLSQACNRDPPLTNEACTP